MATFSNASASKICFECHNRCVCGLTLQVAAQGRNLPPACAHVRTGFDSFERSASAEMAMLQVGWDLIEVGFWSMGPHDRSPNHVDPRECIDFKWRGAAERDVIIAYLANGFLESYELGYSHCRIDDRDCNSTLERKKMGCTTLTDGVYCWPEGYMHYLLCHDVKPPDAFIMHALGVTEALNVDCPPTSAGIRPTASALLRNKNGLQFCNATGEVAVLPRGERGYLRKQSTLQLEGEPDTAADLELGKLFLDFVLRSPAAAAAAAEASSSEANPANPAP